jgi:hypothetical protein
MVAIEVCPCCARKIDGKIGQLGRGKGQRKDPAMVIAKINEMNLHGKVLSPAQIKQIFDYAPSTNVADTLLHRRFANPVGGNGYGHDADKWRFK